MQQTSEEFTEFVLENRKMIESILSQEDGNKCAGCGAGRSYPPLDIDNYMPSLFPFGLIPMFITMATLPMVITCSMAAGIQKAQIDIMKSTIDRSMQQMYSKSGAVQNDPDGKGIDDTSDDETDAITRRNAFSYSDRILGP